MTIKPDSEAHLDEEEVLLDDDVEALRKRLLELLEQGEIKSTKAFLSNKKKATEKVMKKILGSILRERTDKPKWKCPLCSLAFSLIS